MIKHTNYTEEEIDKNIVGEWYVRAAEAIEKGVCDKMIENIANTCDILIDSVNIKATTEEGLGFSGNKEGVLAHAVVMLQKFNIKCR